MEKCYYSVKKMHLTWSSGPKIIKLFSCSTQLSMKFVLLINLKLLIFENSVLLNIAEHEISLLISIKMPTIVDIFILISRENFMLSWIEHEKSFTTSGPDFCIWATTSENVSSDVPRAKIQISLGICTVWSESLLGTFRIAKDALFLHAGNEDWSGCVDPQAELSLSHVRRYIFSHGGSCA